MAAPMLAERAPFEAPRALHVERVACEPAREPDGYPALVVSAPIRATAVRGETITVEALFHDLHGRSVGSMPELTDTVAHSDSIWSPFRIDVPGRLLGLSPAVSTRVVVNVTARCADLSSGAQCEVTYPQAPSPVPLRAVRLVGVSAAHGQYYIPTGLNLQAAPGHRMATVPVATATRVDCRVEADGLRGETLELSLELRLPDDPSRGDVVERPEGSVDRPGQPLRRRPGRPVAVGAQAPPGFAGEGGRFRAVRRDAIHFDNASWNTISAWIPTNALDLTPGQTHRLILTSRVSASGFVAWAEQEIDLVRPAVSPPPSPRPAERVDATALLDALVTGDTERALAQLDAGVPADARDARGATALHLAAAYGQTEVAQRLIARGAALDTTDSAGRTPLHMAALGGRDATLSMLLQQGALATVRDRYGRRAADLAGNEACADMLRRATEVIELKVIAPARRCVEEFLAARSLEFGVVSIDPTPDGARALVSLKLPGSMARQLELYMTIGMTRTGDHWSATTFRREVRP